MRLTPTQKTILSTVDAKTKITSYDLGQQLGIPSGPAARSARSLVEQDLLKSATNKDGETVYSRTAEGSKVAKKL
jgi:DNA-binding MarR family transcriptional regulator